MKLIVGLGNPGNEYKNTRHNIGFNVIDFISLKKRLSFTNNKKFNALECSTIINGEKVILIKPLSYMNLSGTVVRRYCNFYSIASNDVMVIQDDLDMPLGKIRILFNSSSGGHNGIKNIEENLGTREYTRLKVGISKNNDIDTKDYVLGKFSNNDLDILNDTYGKLENLLEDFIINDINNLKQIYNNK